MKNMKAMALLLALLASGIAAQAQIILPEPTPDDTQPYGIVTKERMTHRDFLDEKVPIEMMSNILWAAYGFNRPDEMRRTVPSARNAQELDIYVFNADGVFLYNAEKNYLELVLKEDHRKDISRQSFFEVASEAIVIVANHDRMEKFSADDRVFYSTIDAGYVSQQIYLMCANYHLGTVACGAINRDELGKLLKVKNGRVLIAHPIGMIK